MGTQNSGLSPRRKILNLVIFIFCSIVTACVIWVLLFRIKPNLNAPGALGSACMDIVCMCVLLILVLSVTLDKEKMSRTTRLFLCMMLGTKWALFFDFLTWSADGSLAYGDWTYVFTIASLCSGSIIGAIFVMYLASYLEEMYGWKRAWRSAKVCFVCNIIAFFLTVTLAVTHTAFVFVEGHYETGVLYDVITILPILTLIYMSAYAIAHFKIIGTHDAIAVAVYILIMIVGAVMEAIYGIGTTYVSLTIADVFIFVMLQNRMIDRAKKQKELLAEKVDEEKKNVEKWKKKSNTDEVTGFFNRHAYEADIEALAKNKLGDEFVYLSMDVNGLKVVNDTLGHDAGDELIVGASECMKKCFGLYGKLYRTGGDEFTALMNISNAELDVVKKEFSEATKEWKGRLVDNLTVSCGYVTMDEAKNMNLHQIAVLADKRMYENKTKYYQKRGIDRRGQRDAHVALCALYTKILKINVFEDTYQIVNMDVDEKTQQMGFAPEISTWLINFGTTGQVHPDDLGDYLVKTKLDNIKEHFAGSRAPYRVFYRRMIDGGYKQAMMEIIPASDYKVDAQNLFLYVKNIERED